jgi:hypothetical protein
MFEDYDHVNISLQPSNDEIKNFIAWDLEREHGDLGLGSSARKPPLSALGSLLHDFPGSASRIVDEIVDLVDGHIGLARARLDAVHEAKPAEELQRGELQLFRHQLPSNIVDLYAAAVTAIERQSSQHRDLGLKAIAASSQDIGGVSVLHLRDVLNTSVATRLRSGEDILQAARGFLVATPYGDTQKMFAFHRTFRQFVLDAYSISIHKAYLDLQCDVLASEALTHHIAAHPESLNLSENPKNMTNLERTDTKLRTADQVPSRTYVVRSGTRRWR